MHVCVKMMSKGLKEALTVLIMGIFYFFRLHQHRIFCRTLQHTMQHAACSFDPFDIPWILQKLLFSHTSFWWEDFLNFSNHLPDSSFA